jgi:chemotaxis signal transduction protein
MVADEQVDRRRDEDEQEEGTGLERLWCYLVVLRGALYAIPDEEHTVLMPHINRLAAVTPLPLGLVPPYVLGLINVGQNGEVVVDLGAYLGLAGEPPPREQRRLLVIGERGADHRRGRGADDTYRLALAVDGGQGLETVRSEGGLASASGSPFVRGTVETRYGGAALLDMAAICADIVRALGAGRPWSAPAKDQAPAEGHELPEREKE